MGLKITSGLVQRPVRALIYGPEGIGKSTFGSKFPKPLFIDIEDGTARIDVARAPKPSSWTMANAMVEQLAVDSQGYQTLVFDTADSLERLCVIEILAKYNATSLVMVAGGFGKGFVVLAEEEKRFLDKLTNMQERNGMNVVFLAHSKIRHANIPSESGEFDRYEVRMEEKSCAPLREWVDVQLFVNYKTYVETSDNKNGKARATGGTERVMYAAHNACWDAKNRYGLPSEMPFEFEKIAHIFASPQQSKAAPAPAVPVQEATPIVSEAPTAVIQEAPAGLPECLPKALRDLMNNELKAVTVDELMLSIKGSYVIGTPVENVPMEFWTEKVVPSWDKIISYINKKRNA